MLPLFRVPVAVLVVHNAQPTAWPADWLVPWQEAEGGIQDLDGMGMKRSEWGSWQVLFSRILP